MRARTPVFLGALIDSFDVYAKLMKTRLVPALCSHRYLLPGFLLLSFFESSSVPMCGGVSDLVPVHLVDVLV